MSHDLHLLLGRALGVLEAQPEGPRAAYSRRAYERYARRGVEGFAGWDIDERRADYLVRAGRRMLALERLQNGAERLSAALGGRDGDDAGPAAEEVRRCLEELREVRPRRRTGNGGDRP